MIVLNIQGLGCRSKLIWKRRIKILHPGRILTTGDVTHTILFLPVKLSSEPNLSVGCRLPLLLASAPWKPIMIIHITGDIYH